MLGKIYSRIQRFFSLTSNLSNPAAWFVGWAGGHSSDSGIAFGRDTALRYPPIWYGINKIAGHVGTMPLVLYERKGDRGRDRAVKHPAYYLAKVQPNQWMGSAVFKETITAHAILLGNGRAAIRRNRYGHPLSLDVIDSAKTCCVLVRNTETDVNEKFHVYQDDETHQQAEWHDRDVLHIQGLGSDGFVGYSLNDLASNSMGLGLAAEKSTNRFYKNNAVPELILEAPAGAFRKEEDAVEFLKRFNAHHQGTDNQGKVGLLREGITARPITQTSRDAQGIDQRKFQRQEAALWLGLEQILGDDTSVSYNSLEQKNLAYLTNCLLRWLIKWEQECGAKLLNDEQRRKDTHFFKFTTAALLRGTTKERYEVYQIGRQIEVLSANDVREREDMNPREGGDDYANPAINPKDKNADGQVDDTFKNAAKLLGHDSGYDVARKVIATRLREIIRVEVKRVRDAAKAPDKFLDKLDSFYKTFENRVASVFEGCGSTSDMAGEYVEQSRVKLLDVAGSATVDELADMVRDDTSTWGDRADEWADKIMEIQDD